VFHFFFFLGESCRKVFCGLYWDCASPFGIFKYLKDHKMTSIPDQSLQYNKVEQMVLKHYLDDNSKTIDMMWKEILKNLDDGTFKYNQTPSHLPMKSTSAVCEPCATKTFGSLISDYRNSLPKTAIRLEYQKKPNCHYGSACRTQNNAQHPSHPQKFNHICPQTKFD